MKLSNQECDFLRLLSRSPDRGDGWRSVSRCCWNAFVVLFENTDLLQIDDANHRCRLTAKGLTVLEYCT